MPGSENFNDGATLADKGWFLVADNMANTAGAGEDGSYALQATGFGTPLWYGGGGRMPISPCVESRRIQVTWRWNRVSIPHGDVAFGIGSNGANPSAWGGTTDDWLLLLIYFWGIPADTSTVNAQVMTNGDGGMNLWNIPNVFPPFGDWYTFRVEVIFSSGFLVSGTDGATPFGIYPGSVDTSGAVPSIIRDGEFRTWYGPDESSLALSYEITGIGIPNPYARTPPQTTKPYTWLEFSPGGVLDNIVWDDFCTGAPPPTTPPTVPSGGQCCESNAGPGTTENPDQTPPSRFVPFPPATFDCTGDGIVPEGGQGLSGEDWSL